MVDLEKAQQAIDTLRGEQDTLTAIVAELEAQSKLIDSGLDEKYALAERQQTPAAIQAAEQAEQAKVQADAAVRRKRAALAAVVVELATAEQDLKTAQLHAAVAELTRIHAKMVTVAQRLSDNLLQPDLWLTLIELTDAGRTQQRKLRTVEPTAELFIEPMSALDTVCAQLKGGLDRAVNAGRQGKSKSEISISVSDALYLNRAERKIAGLKAKLLTP